MFEDYDTICVVCHRNLGPSPATYGERTYCDVHIDSLWQDRPELWRAISSQVVAMPGLIIATLILTQALGIQATGNLRVPLSVAVAILPGFVWLTAIMFQTLRAGNDIQFLATVTILGGLLATAIGLPFLQDIVDINTWLPNSSLIVRFMGSILLIGPTHIFLIYIVVRFTVLRTTAFERRTDGILYAMATAIGYATLLNVQFATSQSGFDIDVAIFRVTADVIGHTTAAAILGYFLGIHRFENTSILYLPGGLVIAAVIDGIFVYSRSEINRTSLSATKDAFSPWPGLVVSFFLASLCFIAIYSLLQRSNKLAQIRTHSH